MTSEQVDDRASVEAEPESRFRVRVLIASKITLNHDELCARKIVILLFQFLADVLRSCYVCFEKPARSGKHESHLSNAHQNLWYYVLYVQVLRVNL